MNKMRDDHDFNMLFVQIVQKEPCLYDRTLPEYRNKDEHDRVWQKISNEVGESVSHCKERWRNLRACLTRHLKHFKKISNYRGGSDSNSFHKPYYLAEHMKFLLPFTKSRPEPHELQSLDDTQDDDTSAAIIDSHKQESDSSHEIAKIEKHQIYLLPSSYNIEKSSTSAVQLELSKVKAELKRQHHSDTVVEVVEEEPVVAATGTGHQTSYIEISCTDHQTLPKRPRLSTESTATTAVPTNPTNPQEIDDADLNFFKSLLPDIRQMAPSQKRKFKIGIFELLNTIFDNE